MLHYLQELNWQKMLKQFDVDGIDLKRSYKVCMYPWLAGAWGRTLKEPLPETEGPKRSGHCNMRSTGSGN